MIRVFQRKSTPTEPIGDCFSACLASILELPLEDVPVFTGPPYRDRAAWQLAVNDWLRIRGYTMVAYSDVGLLGPECFHIVWGPTDRNDAVPVEVDDDGDPTEDRRPTHAVVVYGDRIVHDPGSGTSGRLTEVTYRCLLAPTDWNHIETPSGRREGMFTAFGVVTIIVAVTFGFEWLVLQVFG